MKSGGPNSLLDLAANDKEVHADFFNGKLKQWHFIRRTTNVFKLTQFCFSHPDFEDLCDEKEETASF